MRKWMWLVALLNLGGLTLSLSRGDNAVALVCFILGVVTALNALTMRTGVNTLEREADDREGGR